MAEIVFDSAIFIGFRIYLVNGVQIVFRLRVLVGVDKPVALAFISELIGAVDLIHPPFFHCCFSTDGFHR